MVVVDDFGVENLRFAVGAGRLVGGVGGGDDSQAVGPWSCRVGHVLPSRQVGSRAVGFGVEVGQNPADGAGAGVEGGGDLGDRFVGCP
ncbi:hypothetical protein [Nocardia sp. NPDC051981]|uniref:hypothetical protein n=1 Tax=Nocardia sp. NPDC051981 TaxID=3155417 RepID=UPI003431527E